MGRPGTWGPRGTRERTSPSLWAKPVRWNRLAAAGLLPDGKANPDGHRPRVFCASLADVFEPRPELAPWRSDLFALIAATPHLDWLVLTKRPEEARDWLRRWYHEPFASGTGTLLSVSQEWTSRDGIGWGVLPNLWMGTSIGDARYTWRADALREIPAAVRFLSCEPLVGSLYPQPSCFCTHGRESHRRFGGLVAYAECCVEGCGCNHYVQDRALSAIPGGVPADSDAQSGEGEEGLGSQPAHRRAPLDLTGIDWVIVGGESQQGARRMEIAWAVEIFDAARESGAAFHMKQMGAVLGRELGGGSHGNDPRFWPPALRVQEFPSSSLVAT